MRVPLATNVTVMAFNVTDKLSGHKLDFLRIYNWGRMAQGSEIANVELWVDSGTESGKWDSGDTFVTNLLPEWGPGSHSWTNSGFGTDIYNGGAGQNFIVTIDITANPNPSREFQGHIDMGDVRCSSGCLNLHSIENKYYQVITTKVPDGGVSLS